MKGLRLQDGCHNCRHRFVMMEHDGEYQIHCAIDGGRPPCGSVMLDERFPGLDDYDDPEKHEKFAAAWDTWLEWSRPRRVEPAHICDLFEAD